MTERRHILRLSDREVKNDVWQYLKGIAIGLCTVSDQKLPYPNRAISLRVQKGGPRIMPASAMKLRFRVTQNRLQPALHPGQA